MSSVVFAGPSLHGVTRPEGLVFAPPAAQGDLIAAAKAGATHIGLIDGYFGATASVWHKEILYTLANGCQVFGAASMGALRAAECHSFGMKPIGAIAEAYITGQLTDDADVALLHGPAEFDYPPFTEPMVDVRPTIAALETLGHISAVEAQHLLDAAQNLHFSDRTVDALLEASLFSPIRRAELADAYAQNAVRTKQADARLLLERILSAPAAPPAPPAWRLNASPALAHLLAKP